MAEETNIEIQQDAYGIVLSLTTGVDMTTTENLMIKIRKPDNTLVSHDLTPGDILNAEDGIVGYTIQEGDLDQAGHYKLQIIDNTEGRYLPSSIIKFKVVANV